MLSPERRWRMFSLPVHKRESQAHTGKDIIGTLFPRREEESNQGFRRIEFEVNNPRTTLEWMISSSSLSFGTETFAISFHPFSVSLINGLIQDVYTEPRRQRHTQNSLGRWVWRDIHRKCWQMTITFNASSSVHNSLSVWETRERDNMTGRRKIMTMGVSLTLYSWKVLYWEKWYLCRQMIWDVIVHCSRTLNESESSNGFSLSTI